MRGIDRVSGSYYYRGMRGDDRQSAHLFSYVSPEERVPADHPLRAIRTQVDALLRKMSSDFDELYAAVGRPPFPPSACCARNCCRASIRFGASGC